MSPSSSSYPTKPTKMKAIGPDDKIPCPTVETLLVELEKLEEALEGEEREDTWERFERGLLRFAAVTRGGGYRFGAVFVEGMGVKGLGGRVVECMLSDRGRLSGVATDFLTSMAPRLGSQFSPLIPLYLPPTIRLLARPNKVYLRRAEKCLVTIVTHCPLPSLITLIKPGIEDKNEACRRSCGAALEKIVREWDKDLVGPKGVVELEVAMRRMATEKDAEVRKIGKRMWESYAARWPERIEQFTAPLTPTIKKYLDISQTKSSTSRTLFAAPAARAKHPLSQTTTAAESTTRPPMASRQTSTTTSKDRQLQAMRGLGRTTSSENASGTSAPVAGNGIRPFLLRSASAAVPSSAGVRTGMLRSASAANVFAHDGGHLEEEDEEGSTDTASTTSATRPRVITQASAPDVATSTLRTMAQRGAASGITTTGGPARRARIVSGLTQVNEGRPGSSSTGLGLGRPQGAVRPAAGRVLSNSATIGVGSRGVGTATSKTAAVKPRTMVSSVTEQREQPRNAVASSSGSGIGQQASEVTSGDVKSAMDEVKKRPLGTKTITTNPAGTTKTRQFFRPTPTASLQASTNSNASLGEGRPAEPRRIASRTASGTIGRSGGLTAPTASSGAKVVHRVLAEPLHPQTTGGSASGAPKESISQPPLAKLVVSPRKPRQKLKPSIPAFMPTSRNRVLKDGKPVASMTAVGARPRVKSSASMQVLEPANIPLPESPAPKTVAKKEANVVDYFSSSAPLEDITPSATSVPLPTSPTESTNAVSEKVPEEQVARTSKQISMSDSEVAGDPLTLDETSAEVEAATVSLECGAETAPTRKQESSVVEGDIATDDMPVNAKDERDAPETANRVMTSGDSTNDQNVPPALEVNLIDLDGPEPDFTKAVNTQSPAKRTPLGVASPNRLSFTKVATPKKTSPKVKQLQDFFEKKAFSPSPSPEQQTRLVQSAHRASTTPASTPSRPRVLS